MLIVMDGNYLCHLARFGKNGVDRDGVEKGIIHDLLEYTLNLSAIYHTNRFVWTWDSDESVRKVFYPKYKERRSDAKDKMNDEDRAALDSMFRQLIVFRDEILPNLGFKNNLLQDGLEGDDLMAMICHMNPQERIILVSSDQDLYQLITPKISIQSMKTECCGKRYGMNQFLEEWPGLIPSQWVLVKAIGGCKSDEVPGIGMDKSTGVRVVGVGEVSAYKFLTDSLSESSKVYKRIVSDDGMKEKEFNLKLVKLPHPNTKGVGLVENEFNPAAFTEFFETWGFNDFLIERIDEWNTFFENGWDR